jgi:hypothetical protein
VNPSSPNGRSIGFALVRTDDQNFSLQFDALAQHGVGSDSIFTDKLSGAKDDRPDLARCPKAVKADDTLVVWRLVWLGRSLRHRVTAIRDPRPTSTGTMHKVPRGLGRSARPTSPKRDA